MTTLCFPGIRAQLAALGRRSIQSLRQAILFQLGQNLRELIPVHILAWIFHTISSRDAARARLARRAKRFGVGLYGNILSVEEREANAARRARSKSQQKWYEISGLASEDDGPNSRDRAFPLRLTCECFIWQMLNPGASCREVVRHVQAVCRLLGRAPVDEGTSAYVQARQRVPQERLEKVMQPTATAADCRAGDGGCLQGRPITEETAG